MNFEDFFPCEIVESVKELSPGYDDHASDVWYVKTDKREVVIRASGIKDVKQASAFFKSLNILFGIDPSKVFTMRQIHTTLSGIDAFIYPKILELHQLDREYAVVEFLKGTTLASFRALSDDELRKFGSNLAKIHIFKCVHIFMVPVQTDLYALG